MRAYQAKEAMEKAFKEALPSLHYSTNQVVAVAEFFAALEEYVDAKCQDMHDRINRTGEYSPDY